MSDILSQSVRSALVAIGVGVLSIAAHTGTANAADRSHGSKGEQVAAADADAVVKLTSNLKFDPATVTITVGDTVEWRNVSGFGHTVTADPDAAADPGHVALPDGAGTFNKSLGGDGTYRRTFEKPGVYKYVCLPHEGAGMLGKVVVKQAS